MCDSHFLIPSVLALAVENAHELVFMRVSQHAYGVGIHEKFGARDCKRPSRLSRHNQEETQEQQEGLRKIMVEILKETQTSKRASSTFLSRNGLHIDSPNPQSSIRPGK